ncbi:MAG: hypothetical protein F6K11_34190 [Leptolyngbya sp. SIO3F4]|nr:hypothetical protein [Leptolyngbya sp. SIO3F4]
MIAFKDFVAEQVAAGGLFTGAKYESIEDVVARANDWIKTSDIKVLNVETVVLPGVPNLYEKGSAGLEIKAFGKSSDHWWQFIRVWYHAE